jgi:predicted  nucleic acid-binding Zn-ribbon protein
MTTISELKQRLADIEAEIRAVEERLPAHSAKPAIMQELFDIEEKREELVKELARLNAAPDR